MVGGLRKVMSLYRRGSDVAEKSGRGRAKDRGRGRGKGGGRG